MTKKRTLISPYKYEFCVYSQLVNHMEQGLIFCNDTIQYKSFEADLGITADNKEKILKLIDIPKLTTPIVDKLKALK